MRTSSRRPFITIPLRWFQRAAHTPGVNPVICAVLWWRAFQLHREHAVRIDREHLQQFAVSRRTCRRTVRALEDAGLVRVHHVVGKGVDVDLLAETEAGR
jgi:hypothetical protein